MNLPAADKLREAVSGGQALTKAVHDATGIEPRAKCAPWVCDPNFWFPEGQPAVAYGADDVEQGIYEVDEYIPNAKAH